MTQEALKLALEALENMSAALREDDVLGSDSELMLNAITAIRETLAHDDEDAIIIQYHEATIKILEKRIEELTAQPEEPDYKEALRVLSLALEEAPTNLTPKQRSVWQQSKAVLLSGGGVAQPVAWEQFHEHLVERNFCPRCGKRTDDPTTIHTCTPPQSQRVNLTVDELIDLERKHLSHENLTRAIEAKLKEKNT